MSRFVIQGGRSLSGSIRPQGSKNEALQVICATLLTDHSVEIDRLPQIKDVTRLIDIVKGLGVEIEALSEERYRFSARSIDTDQVSSSTFMSTVGQLRGSVMLLAPLLKRLGRVEIPMPGGDKIGRRRLDVHIQVLSALGAKFEYCQKQETYKFWFPQGRNRFKGTDILLEEASVTGTANLIMAAVTAEGCTEIYHAAAEPYIQQLCLMLQRMGAEIEGIGSNRLFIRGVEELHGTTHTLQSDIIEVGSFIGMAALTASSIRIESPNLPHLSMIIGMFNKLGIEVRSEKDSLFVPRQECYRVRHFIDGSMMTIYDGIWPALSPDLISIGIVTALQAEGAVLFHQRMFESRLFFVDKLISMGGQLILCDPHRVTVIGLGRKKSLQSIRMTSPDIRAGVALLLAALSAEGESVIENIEQIDRGYSHIEQRLTALGASIQRVS